MTVTDGIPSRVPAAPVHEGNTETDPAMVVVLSEATAGHLASLAGAGWPGTVLVVGSVAEAREALAGDVPERLPQPGGLRLDADSRSVVHAPESEQLTPLEYGLLEALLADPGRVLSFADLTSTVWGTTYTGDCSHLHAVVRRLRVKLEAVSAPVHLAAVRGVGFRLAPLAPLRGGALRSL